MGAFADAPTGGASYAPPPPPPPDPSTVPLGQPQPTVPGTQAVLLPDGTAAAPADAPPQVQNADLGRQHDPDAPVQLRRRPQVLHLAPRL